MNERFAWRSGYPSQPPSISPIILPALVLGFRAHTCPGDTMEPGRSAIWDLEICFERARDDSPDFVRQGVLMRTSSHGDIPGCGRSSDETCFEGR